MRGLRFEITRDAEAFAGRAESFLAARIERNMLATVLVNLRDGSVAVPDPVFASGIDERGEVRAVALRTPPWPMLATNIDAGDADTLLDAWLRPDPQPPGVNGQAGTARAIAGAWSAKTGRRARVTMREAMHVLEEVSGPPRPGCGALRLAVPSERLLLIDWMRAFGQEAACSVTIGRWKLSTRSLPAVGCWSGKTSARSRWWPSPPRSLLALHVSGPSIPLRS